MKHLSIWSWNVNGIRAVASKGGLEPLKQASPDILCLQETKAHPEQLPSAITQWEGYESYFSAAQKKGYSGVALYTKLKPKSVQYSFGDKRFDQEGRILMAEYEAFILLNIYFPNGQMSSERLAYKMEFYAAFLAAMDKLKRKGKKIIFGGDVNTAHKEIDLARPKENSERSGFLPQERAWLDQVVDHGYLDSFRLFHPEPDQYTWWDYKTRARERNVGWRIDYFFISPNLKSQVMNAGIRTDIYGSDHCPITLELKR